MRCIFETELPRVYDYVEVFLGRYKSMYTLDSSDLADIQQETIMSWWKYVRNAKTKIPPKALVRVIARRRLYDFIRQERRYREISNGVDSFAVESCEPVLSIDAIFEEIHALPDDETTLVFKRIEGHTYREIAREQKVHERTIRSRWTKVRSRLRIRLSSRLRQEHDERRLTQLACV